MRPVELVPWELVHSDELVAHGRVLLRPCGELSRYQRAVAEVRHALEFGCVWVASTENPADLPFQAVPVPPSEDVPAYANSGLWVQAPVSWDLKHPSSWHLTHRGVELSLDVL